MDILLWFLVIEDIHLLTIIGFLLFSRERWYITIALVTLVTLLFTNVLLFRGSHTGFLLIIPPIMLTIMALLVRPYANRSNRSLSIHTSKFLAIFLGSICLLLIMFSILIAFRIFLK